MFKHPESVQILYDDLIHLDLPSIPALEIAVRKYEDKQLQVYNGLAEVVFNILTDSVTPEEQHIVLLLNEVIKQMYEIYGFTLTMNYQSEEESLTNREYVYFDIPFEEVFIYSKNTEHLIKQLDKK